MRALPGAAARSSASRACSTSPSSHSESPTSWPCARRNGKHIAPPIRSASASSSKRSITAILSATLAPPSTATSGRAGCSRMPSSVRTSRSSSRPARAPAAGARRPRCSRARGGRRRRRRRRTTSASAASARASSGSLLSSPGSKRTFSSSSISPSPSRSASALTSSPTTAGRASRRRRSARAGAAATGAIDSAGSRLAVRSPEMRDQHEPRAALAQLLDRRQRGADARVVGDHARLPSASVASGTLKSTRTSTRRPSTARSSMLLTRAPYVAIPYSTRCTGPRAGWSSPTRCHTRRPPSPSCRRSRPSAASPRSRSSGA